MLPCCTMAGITCLAGLDISGSRRYAYSIQAKGKTMTLPAEVREYLKQRGEQPAQRGRLATQDYVVFFAAHPKRARAIANEIGFSIPQRGRISAATLVSLAKVVR